jgi:HEAT repeat protein
MSRLARGIVFALFVLLFSPAPALAGWGCPRFFEQLPTPRGLESHGIQARIEEQARPCEVAIPKIHLWLDELGLLRPEMREWISDPDFDKYSTVEQIPVECIQVGIETFFGISFYRGEGWIGAGGLGRYDPASDTLEIRRPKMLREASVRRLVHAGDSFWVATEVHFEGSDYGSAPGLLRYDWERDVTESFEGREEGPCGYEVADLVLRDGALWAATDLTLSRLDEASGAWTHWGPDGEETRCDLLYQELHEAFTANNQTTNGACDLGNSTLGIFEAYLEKHRPALLAELRGEAPQEASAPSMPTPRFPTFESIGVRAKVSHQKGSDALVFSYDISTPSATTLNVARFRVNVSAEDPFFDSNSRGPAGLSLSRVRPDFRHPSVMREEMALTPDTDGNGWEGSIDEFHFATWRAPSGAPSTRGPALAARALPGLSHAFMEPDLRNAIQAFTARAEGTVDEDELQLQALRARAQFVVPGPVPAPRRIDLWSFVEYIEGLASAAERRGWIEPKSLPWRSELARVRDDLLMARFGDASAELEALLEHLDAISCMDFECEGAVAVTSEGYALLYFNLEFLRAEIITFPDKLAKSFETGDNASLRQAAKAVDALGSVAATAAPELIRGLRSPDEYLRKYAAAALGSIQSDADEVAAALVDAVAHSDRWTVRAALDALRLLGPRAKRFATRHIQAKLARSGSGETPDSPLRWLRALAAIGDEGTEVIREVETWRHHSDSSVRAAAVSVIADSGPSESAAQALVEALSDPDRRVREEATRGLARWGLERSTRVPPIQQVLKALGHRPPETPSGTETALLDALGSSSTSAANFAIYALAHLKSPGPEATSALLARFPNDPRRGDVARALAQSGSDAIPHAVEKLLAIAASDETRERNSAALLLLIFAQERPTAIPLDPLLQVARQWAPHLSGQYGVGLLQALRRVASANREDFTLRSQRDSPGGSAAP